MLLNEILGDLIKSDLKKQRGRNLKKIVKAASQRGNPSTHGLPFVPAPTMSDVTVAKGPAEFSALL